MHHYPPTVEESKHLRNRGLDSPRAGDLEEVRGVEEVRGHGGVAEREGDVGGAQERLEALEKVRRV